MRNMKNKELHKELKEQAPILSELKKKGYKPTLPDGYFEQLRREVRAQLETPAPAKSRHVRKMAFSPLRLAASVSLLIGLSFLLFHFLRAPQLSGTENIASAEEIEAYVFSHIDEFDEDMLLEYYVAGETNGKEAESATKEEDPFQAIPDQELDEYLDDILDDIDETTLENLL